MPKQLPVGQGLRGVVWGEQGVASAYERSEPVVALVVGQGHYLLIAVEGGLVRILLELVHGQRLVGPACHYGFTVPGDVGGGGDFGVQLVELHDDSAEYQLGDNQEGDQDVDGYHGLEAI